MKRVPSCHLLLWTSFVTMTLSGCKITPISSSSSGEGGENSDSFSSGEEETLRWATYLFGPGSLTNQNPYPFETAHMSEQGTLFDDGSTHCYGQEGAAIRMDSQEQGGLLALRFSSAFLFSSFRVLAFSASSSVSASNSVLTLSLGEETYEITARCKDQWDALEVMENYDDLSRWSDLTGLTGYHSSLRLSSDTEVYVAGIAFSYRNKKPATADSSSSSSNSDSSSKDSSALEDSSTQDSFPSVDTSYSHDSSSDFPYEDYTPSEHPEDWTSWQNGSYTNYIDYSASTAFRLAAKPSEDGETATCYFYSEERQSFVIGETLRKEGIYTNSSEVSLYYNAFHEFPKNYGYYASSGKANAKMKELYPLYGADSRLYTDYSLTSGYVTVMPSLYQPSGFLYYELDLAYEADGGYASETKVNRSKAGRIVVFPYGTKNYGEEDPYIVKTLDHYAHFREFANYLDGWGANYDGCESDLGDGESLGTYSSVGPLSTRSF